MKVVIVDYGAGNTKSVEFALKRLGFNALVSSNPALIFEADKVIFPGVGEASSAMKMLKENKLDILLPKLTQPVLGICLGMQLMCNFTEEGKTKGLGIFDVEVKKFGSRLKVPQIGWNTIHNLNSKLFVDIREQEYMYLVHSFYADLCEETIAKTDYGISYSSALQKHNFYGVQFHPEKSGQFGAKILYNFLTI